LTQGSSLVLVVCAILAGAAYLLARRFWGFWEKDDAAAEPRAPAGERLSTPAAQRLQQALRAFAPRPGWRLLLTVRGDTLVALLAADAAPQAAYLDTRPANDLALMISRGEVTRLLARRLSPSGQLGRIVEMSPLLDFGRGEFVAMRDWLAHHAAPSPPPADRQKPFTPTYFDYLERLAANPELIDFIYLGYASLRNELKPGRIPPAAPFDEPAKLPNYLPAQPKRRSVVFLHNAYYHFNILAEALRRRGWEALTVSLESPTSAQRQYMQGEDLNLYDADSRLMNQRIREFFRTVPERFGALHFTGQGVGSFFPSNYEASDAPVAIPWDLMELRRQGVLVGYTPSGCLDGPRQSSIRAVSGGVCARCVWETRPDVCSDAKNGAWARKLESLCDWVSVDGDWAVDERTGSRAVRAPVTTALDPQVWRPDIQPPEDMRIDRAPGEILIYHAVGNYEARRAQGRDIKGTGAVLAAIERLKAEGLPVRLVFATDVPSSRVRFLQVQADIVVDQLNYGRHGANARESFMLGKPVITRLEPRQGDPLPPLRYLEESPALAADEGTVYEVLRQLIGQPERWPALGAAGRAYAMRWHDADACAQRYERILDRVARGLPAEAEEVFA
jgi:hypothetical protein